MTTDERVTELEIRIAFQDKLIAELDEVVRGLRDELERVSDELGRLKNVVEVDRGTVVDEKPPHW